MGPLHQDIGVKLSLEEMTLETKSDMLLAQMKMSGVLQSARIIFI